MMKHFSTSIVSSLVLLSALVFYGAIAQERWSKEWEEMIEKTQPSETIMDSIGVKPAMSVAEIGAGNGRLAVRLAKRVGPSGTVYANDIDKRALEFMRKRCEDEKIRNMVVVEGGETDPRLPRGKLDVVILANTIHMVEKPVLLLKKTMPSLKPGGVLAVIEPDLEKVKNMGHMMGSMAPKENWLATLREAGFELVREHGFLPRHFLAVFRVKK